MDEIIKLDSVSSYNRILGTVTLHPLISIADFSQLKTLKHCRKNFSIYAIFYKELSCGDLSYGRGKYDYQNGTLLFIAPGQVAGANDGGETPNPKGLVLMFHPDLLYGTPLARKIKDYSFFSYDSNEALHMSDRERHIILNCFHDIREELEHPLDKHSKQIIVSNIEVMLNYCSRFYDRQFVTRKIHNKDLLNRFEEILHTYFLSDRPRTIGLPSVKYCAEQLCLSPNYFGDLIKKETGKSAQEYIQQKIIEEAKELLSENHHSVSEIAYKLGYKYPHHLSRMFKKIIGISPNEYKKAIE